MKTLKKHFRIGSYLFLSSGVLLSPLSHAIEFKVNGFASLVAGAVLSGENGDYMENVSGYDCPCFIGDYANAGVYEGSHWDFAPDSRAGIQLASLFNDEWSLTTQVVGHGGNDMKPELSALYASWKTDSGVNVNLGRQRLPLFYFSDFYDVGYAYPWIRVPADLYGWPVSSYNGASIDFSDDLGDGTYRLSLLAGEEEDHNDLMYAEIYYASKDFITEWKNMVGVSASYQYDWFDMRAVYMTNKAFAEADYGAAGGGKSIVYDHIHQEFTGLAFNVDYNNLIIRSEGNIFRLPKRNFDSFAKMFAIGYRIGPVTPMLTYSRYDDFDQDFGRSHYRTSSATVRWDVIRNTALKIQYDVVDDKMDWVGYTGFIGDTRTLSIGVDYVF